MDFLKRNIGMTIVSGIGLALSIGCIVIIVKTHKEAAQFQQQVIDIKQSLEKFQRTQFALTQGNVEVANANSELAKRKYEEFMQSLSQRRAKDDLGSFSRLGAKNHLTKICTKMENQLRSSDITVQDSQTSFSFGQWMGQDVLPGPDEIPLILRNLEIAQELVYLLSQAQVQSVDEFSRQAELEPVERGLYSYISFGIRVGGTVESVRIFLNSLNQASYFFIVRSVNVKTPGADLRGPTSASATESATEDRDSPGAGRGRTVEPGTGQSGTGASAQQAYLPKRDRVLFSEQRVVVAEIAVDYVEFHIKE
jgi:hypothetical protein